MSLLPPKAQLILGALAVVFAIVMWAAFIRAVPTRAGVGTITGKTLKAARDVKNTPLNDGRSTLNPSSVRIPQGYAFEVELPDGAGTGVHYLEEKFGEPFQVGQKVKVSYQVKGLPPLWKRTFVLEMDPAGP